MPPGKAGLVVATVRVDGTISSPERNDRDGFQSGTARVFHPRRATSLYDGDVEKIGLDGVTFRREFERRVRQASRTNGDETNLRECRRAAMRIMWRAWGLGALVAAGLILSNGALRAERCAGRACEGGGQGRRGYAWKRRPTARSNTRPIARARTFTCVDLSGVSAARSGGSARGGFRSGEELSRRRLTRLARSRWCAWKF